MAHERSVIMKLSEYLQRIEWSGAVTPTLDTLENLLRQHNHRVPFENLDVQLGNELSTRIEDAYAKIVEGRRGGWCYEQNGLFGRVLEELGFDVVRIAATVMRGAGPCDAPDNHLCLLVSSPDIDDRYLCLLYTSDAADD